MRRRNRFTVRVVSLAGLAALSVGCATRSEPAEVAAPAGGVAPALVVERFLQAVNARDLNTMARLFGTREGSVVERDPLPEVERRMFTLASVLRYEDYDLDGELIAPGRLGEAVRIMVRMQVSGREIPVPFTVVRTEDATWLVEAIDIEAITTSG